MVVAVLNNMNLEMTCLSTPSVMSRFGTAVRFNSYMASLVLLGLKDENTRSMAVFDKFTLRAAAAFAAEVLVVVSDAEPMVFVSNVLQFDGALARFVYNELRFWAFSTIAIHTTVRHDPQALSRVQALEDDNISVLKVSWHFDVDMLAEATK